MADIYDTNNAQQGNWIQRNSDWLMPIGATAAQIGYNIYANQQNNKFNAQQAEIQRQFNAQEAEKARQYETEMSNTAYQRAYPDMKAAGLNPNLAGGSGGASTPAGSMASGNAAATTGMMPMNMDSALNAALLSSQVENLEANTQKTMKESGKTEAEMKGIEIENQYKEELIKLDMAFKQATTDKEKAQIEEVYKNVHKIEKETRALDEQIEILKSEGKIKEAEAKTRTRNRRMYAAIEMAEGITRSVGNAVGAVKGTKAMPTKSFGYTTIY